MLQYVFLRIVTRWKTKTFLEQKNIYFSSQKVRTEGVFFPSFLRYIFSSPLVVTKSEAEAEEEAAAALFVLPNSTHTQKQSGQIFRLYARK